MSIAGFDFDQITSLGELISPRDRTMDTVRDKIKNWLTEHNWVMGKAETDDAVDWMVNAQQRDESFGVSIGQFKNHPESIILLVTISFEDYQLDLGRMNSKQYKDLLFKMRFRLLPFDAKFVLPDDFSKLIVTRELFTEDITRDKFWQAVRDVSRTVHAAAWTLEEEFAKVVPKPSHNGGKKR